MSALVVRATAEHVADIVRLIAQLRALEGLTEPVSARGVREYLDDPTTVVYLSEYRGDIVGMISLRIMSDLFHGGTTALVQELVVDEERRGAGLGGALLDAAVAHAFEVGCLEVSVTTGETNAIAQELYRSRGFEQDGVYFERHCPT